MKIIKLKMNFKGMCYVPWWGTVLTSVRRRVPWRHFSYSYPGSQTIPLLNCSPPLNTIVNWLGRELSTCGVCQKDIIGVFHWVKKIRKRSLKRVWGKACVMCQEKISVYLQQDVVDTWWHIMLIMIQTVYLPLSWSKNL